MVHPPLGIARHHPRIASRGQTQFAQYRSVSIAAIMPAKVERLTLAS
jgi:hypothetical protein